MFHEDWYIVVQGVDQCAILVDLPVQLYDYACAFALYFPVSSSVCVCVCVCV